MVAYDSRPYQIFLTAQDNYWCQYVYQFSHELCHILTNFDLQKEHRHKWFEESLCELASLFVLHRMAKDWVDNPPPCISGATKFAPHYRKYAENVEAKFVISNSLDYSNWLDANIQILESCSTKRELNGVVAVALLPYFWDDPSLWRDCGWLNQWNSSADKTVFDYLNSWSNCLIERNLSYRTPIIVNRLFDSTECFESR